jgi:DNA-directed RNA polymerase subunit omega
LSKAEKNTLNSELVRKALDKVGNPNTLVGIISRRVRQLNSGGGGLSRPLIADAGQLGAADIALREIIEEKIGWEMPVLDTAPLEAKPKRKRK